LSGDSEQSAASDRLDLNLVAADLVRPKAAVVPIIRVSGDN
jgi:hypothetical protein